MIRSRERGSAVIVVLTLLAIALIFIGGNLRTLHYLGREIRLLETKQTRRLAETGAQKAIAAVHDHGNTLRAPSLAGQQLPTTSTNSFLRTGTPVAPSLSSR